MKTSSISYYNSCIYLSLHIPTPTVHYVLYSLDAAANRCLHTHGIIIMYNVALYSIHYLVTHNLVLIASNILQPSRTMSLQR